MAVETAKEQYKRLQRALLKREDIDEVTRAEILNVGSKDDLLQRKTPTYRSVRAASSIFRQAKEGVDMKFKSRKATELMFKTMFDQGDSRRLRGGAMDFGSILRV